MAHAIELPLNRQQADSEYRTERNPSVKPSDIQPYSR